MLLNQAIGHPNNIPMFPPDLAGEKAKDMKEIKPEREVLAETEDGKITIGEKLSLEHCRKVLNGDGNSFTDKEILEIRDFIYAMATIDYMFFVKQFRKNNSINTKQNQSNHEQESISLHSGEYRRAS